MGTFSQNCNCEENTIAQCQSEPTATASKTCTARFYSMCIERCFLHRAKPENDCDCYAHGVYHCTDAPNSAASQCRTHFNAQCQRRCEPNRSKKKHSQAKERGHIIAHQVSGTQRSLENKKLADYCGFVSENGCDLNGTFSMNASIAESSPFRTLQKAFNELSSLCTNSFTNATLYLMPGTYNASISISNCTFNILSNSSRQAYAFSMPDEPPSSPDVIIIPSSQNDAFIISSGCSIHLEGLNICSFSVCLNLSNMENVSINRCFFVSNVNSIQASVGGALSILCFGSLKIHHSNFSENYAFQGGAISAVNGTSMEISLSCFYSNFAPNIYNDYGCGGSILLLYVPFVVICNNTFYNNSAEFGGALFLQSIGLTLHNNLFISNHVNAYGGAIAMVTVNFLDFFNNTFISNTALQAGAVFIQGVDLNSCSQSYSYKRIALRASHFYNNSASQCAGALKIVCARASIENCIFKGNSAQVYGGATLLYTTSGVSTIRGCHFEGNNAPEGGAIFLQNSSLLITSNFTSNKADKFGGAIYNLGNVTVKGSNFTSNNAGSYGGAVYSCGFLAISSCNFTFNIAKNQGGAIYIDKHSLNTTVTLSNFSSNQATFFGGTFFIEWSTLTLENNHLINNNALFGGAIGTSGTSFVFSQGDHFVSNSATSGGTIYLNSKGCLHCNNSNLTSNSADSNGGAIYCFENCHISLSNHTRLKNNHAKNFGGAIYTKGGNLNICNSLFEENIATGQAGGIGGAIWSDTTQTNIRNSFFKSNCATSSAGAIYLENDSPNISSFISVCNKWENNSAYECSSVLSIIGNVCVDIRNNTFSGNVATLGSSFFLDTIASLKIDNNSYFLNNQGSKGACIMCCSTPLINISFSHFENNSATEEGGVLFSQNCSLSLNESTFKNNSSAKDGGALYFTLQHSINSKIFIENVFFEQNESKNGRGGALFLNASLVVGSSNSFAVVSSNLTKNQASSGGAIYSQFSSCKQSLSNVYTTNSLFSISSSNFIENKATENGGSLVFKLNTDYLQQQIVNFCLKDSNFENSYSLGKGGSIYLDCPMWTDPNEFNVTVISDNQFKNSSSFSNGGAIHINSKANFSSHSQVLSLKIENNYFKQCRSSQSGGAIFWISDLTCCQTQNYKNLFLNNSFEDCVALYGNNLSTPATNLNYDIQSKLIFFGLHFNISFLITDFYLQTVYFLDDRPQIEISPVGNNSASLFQTPYLDNTIKINGSTIFERVSQLGSRDHYYNLSALLSIPNSQEGFNLQKNFPILLSGCPLGYSVSNISSSCRICDAGAYSFNGLSCFICPSNSLSSSNLNCAHNVDDHQYNEYLVLEGFWILPTKQNSREPYFLVVCNSAHCSPFSCNLLSNKHSPNPSCLTKCSSTNSTEQQWKADNATYGFGFCPEGYEGLFCSKCQNPDPVGNKYYKSGNDCMKCLDPKDRLIATSVVFAVVIFSLLFFSKNQLFMALTQIVCIIVFITFGVTSEWQLEIVVLLTVFVLILSSKSEQNQGTSGIIKIIIFYFQTTNLITESSLWPGTIRNFFKEFSFLDLHLSTFSCFLTGWSESIKFLMAMLLPFIFTISLATILLLQRFISPKVERMKMKILEFVSDKCKKKKKKKREFVVNEEDAQEESKEIVVIKTSELMIRKVTPVRIELLRIVLFVFYVSYFDLVSRISENFNCVSSFDGPTPPPLNVLIPRYITKLPWIVCNDSSLSTEYGLLRLQTILFTIVYVFGIPLLFAILLIVNRKIINMDREKIPYFSFYYQNYKLKYFSFELVWMSRRALIALLFNLLSYYPAIQKLSLSSLLIFYAIFNQYIRPFKTDKENLFELIGSFVILFNFIASSFSASQSPAPLISWTLTVINVIFITALFTALFFPTLKSFHAKRKIMQCFRKKQKDEEFDSRKENEPDEDGEDNTNEDNWKEMMESLISEEEN